MLRRRIFWRLLPSGLVLLLLLAAGVFLAVKLPVALAPIAAGERLLSFCAALFVLARAPAESKTYRLLLLLIPWLGAVLCFFLPSSPPPAPSPCAPFGDGVMDACASLAAAGGPAFFSGAEYLSTGGEMFGRLVDDLKGAKEEILLCYYILARGRFFDTVLQILEEKAKNGVKIQLVYDDFGCTGLPKKFAKTLRSRGICASVSSPLRPFSPFRFNLRDHRKLAVIDRRIAYTGGVNLADEYIGEKIRFGHWKDTAVRLTGEGCAEFARLFGEKIAQNAIRIDNSLPCVPFSDSAGGADGRTGEAIILTLFSSARRSLEVCTPYLVPSERVLFALSTAARAGVKVRLMLPHIPDKKSVFLLTRHYARRLQKAGVEVKEYTAGFLHAKSVTADGKYALIGSYNLDRRSLFTQAECGVIIRSVPFAADAVRDFDEMWKAGTPVREEKPFEKLLRILLLPFAPWI